jgi:hypothetical protein
MARLCRPLPTQVCALTVYGPSHLHIPAAAMPHTAALWDFTSGMLTTGCRCTELSCCWVVLVRLLPDVLVFTRLAPLSEGRVEGNELMCSYHGWQVR